MGLDHLPAHSALRLFPISPACDAPTAQRLQMGLDKLFEQFAREARVTAWGCALLASGAVLAVAWQAPETLSGCSHDRLGRLLAHFEDDQRRILTAPPIVIETTPRAADGRAPSLEEATVRCCDRAGVRHLLALGLLSGQSLVWDMQVTTLAALSGECRRPLADHPLGARMVPHVL